MRIQKVLINKTTQKKCRLNCMVPSKRKPHKAKLQKRFSDHMKFTAQQLPRKVDLRYAMTPIEDQSDIGSCVANSFAGAYEYLLKKATGTNIDVSRLFIYYNARVKDADGDSDELEDSGCTVAGAIESLEESGICLESIWPYNTKRVNKCPKDEAYAAAKNHKISDALELNVDLNEMKSCLAQGFPFIFGLELYKSFGKADKKGVVPMPKPGDKSRDTDGSHGMLAVGYSDHSKAFIVRNSWGAEWGDKGYCYIPYGYMGDSDFCWNPWAVRQLETNDMGHEHWDDEDETDYCDDDDEDDDDDDDDDEIEDEEVSDDDEDEDDDDDDD